MEEFAEWKMSNKCDTKSEIVMIKAICFQQNEIRRLRSRKHRPSFVTTYQTNLNVNSGDGDIWLVWKQRVRIYDKENGNIYARAKNVLVHYDFKTGKSLALTARQLEILNKILRE